jgi:hypothetical protein
MVSSGDGFRDLEDRTLEKGQIYMGQYSEIEKLTITHRKARIKELFTQDNDRIIFGKFR